MAEPISFVGNMKVLSGDHIIDPREGAPDIVGLPVWTDGKECVSCWKLSWRERFSALFFGKVWLGVLSGASQPPVYCLAKREYFSRPKPEQVQP